MRKFLGGENSFTITFLYISVSFYGKRYVPTQNTLWILLASIKHQFKNKVNKTRIKGTYCSRTLVRLLMIVISWFHLSFRQEKKIFRNSSLKLGSKLFLKKNFFFSFCPGLFMWLFLDILNTSYKSKKRDWKIRGRLCPTLLFTIVMLKYYSKVSFSNVFSVIWPGYSLKIYRLKIGTSTRDAYFKK